MTLIEVDGLSEDIARLADRSYYIVNFCWLVAREVLNLVQRLIKSRTYEVGHASVKNGELFL